MLTRTSAFVFVALAVAFTQPSSAFAKGGRPNPKPEPEKKALKQGVLTGRTEVNVRLGRNTLASRSQATEGACRAEVKYSQLRRACKELFDLREGPCRVENDESPIRFVDCHLEKNGKYEAWCDIECLEPKRAPGRGHGVAYSNYEPSCGDPRGASGR
jgi:hypothetical protein